VWGVRHGGDDAPSVDLSRRVTTHDRLLMFNRDVLSSYASSESLTGRMQRADMERATLVTNGSRLGPVEPRTRLRLKLPTSHLVKLLQAEGVVTHCSRRALT
jgi:hypothetical protein